LLCSVSVPLPGFYLLKAVVDVGVRAYTGVSVPLPGFYLWKANIPDVLIEQMRGEFQSRCRDSIC